MSAVGIAELKARLSHYLRVVGRGEPVTVLDRRRPVARLVPYHDAQDLVVRKPPPGAPALQDLELPGPAPLDFDVVDLLLEERQTDR